MRSRFWIRLCVLLGLLVGGSISLLAQGGIRTIANLRGSSTLAGSLPALNVAILDATGAQISSFGGGTQYAEDAVAASGDTGTMALAVRNDAAGTTLTSADGDYSAIAVSNKGQVYIICSSGCSGGTQYAEDVAHVSGDLGTLALAIRNDAAAATLTSADGDYSGIAVSNKGQVYVVCSSGCSGGTQYAEDAASASGDLVTLAGVIQLATPATTAADGDYTLLESSGGLLWVRARGDQDSGGTDMTDTTLHALKVAMQNGSTTDTDDGTVSNNAASVAQTIAVLYGFDGTNDVRVRAKTSAPASSDVGLFVRPFLPTDGTNIAIFDPCESSGAAITPIAISQTTSTVLKAGTSSKKTYICGIFVQGADAENLSLVGGTGSVCGTNTVALIGGTSAANGPNGAANGGWVLPVSKVSWTNTTVNADDLCLLQSGSGRVAGVLKVAVQ